MKALLRNIKRSMFHRLKLYPIYRVISAINSKYPLQGSVALEAFAYTGELQTRAFKKYPSYLEAWEISQDCETALRKNLPGAVIKIVDSIEEAKHCDKKFNFINVDTHQGLFGPYCENFEIFPLLFRMMQDECTVNLNVMPEASEQWRKTYPGLFNKEHLERREAFYKTGDPEHVSLEQMLATYGRIAAEKGYKIIWHYYRRRTLTYYLVLRFKKA
ncbi:MAG: hypothetical protein JNL60_02565 [Bacteroidia bacterium]|nr:hypothetical protein [Bacteroidia bacterium]